MPTQNLRTKSARRKLKHKRRPYYAPVRRGVSLGYRCRGAQAGGWCVRVYVGAAATDGATYKYAEEEIGVADDNGSADGVEVFDYGQAQEKALEFARKLSIELRDGGTPITVTEAMQEYMKWYEEHRKSATTAQYTIDAHITPKLGDVRLSDLTSQQIKTWHSNLAKAPLRKRGGAKVKIDTNDPEAIRRRRSTANRILTVLKAGLNYAFREGFVQDDLAWRRASPYRSVDAPKIRYLTVGESERLINCCSPDLRALVRAALLTGARYGELCSLKVSDFDPEAGTVYVHTSKSGKPRHIRLTDEGQGFFEEVTAGKKSTKPIFTSPDDNPWNKNEQYRPMKDAAKKAELEDVGFHVLRHTYASLLVSAGVPLQVVSHALGHADTRTTEKHYAHLQPDYVSEMIRENLPTFIKEKPKVKRLRKKRK